MKKYSLKTITLRLIPSSPACAECDSCLMMFRHGKELLWEHKGNPTCPNDGLVFKIEFPIVIGAEVFDPRRETWRPYDYNGKKKLHKGEL